MLGAETVLVAVKERMDAALPPVLSELRTAGGLSAFELPDPAKVLAHQPPITTLGDWPCVFTMWTGTDQKDTDLTAPEAGSLLESFEFVYTVQVYALVRHADAVSTERMARLYEQAMRSVVLSRKDITPSWVETGESTIINPVKLTSTPWDVLPDDDNRFVSAAYVEFPVVADEQVGSPFPSAGRADTLNAEPGLLE